MKRLLIFALLCAFLLSGCVTSMPEDPMLDGDGMEKTEPDPVPTDEQIEAMRPKLILDGCEPGTADGRTVRITGYQDGKLTAELSNDSGDEWDYFGNFKLSVRKGEQWESIPWPEDWAWPECLYTLEDGQRMTYVFDLTPLGPLDSGEYLLQTDFRDTGCIETTFRLVYTE